MDRDTDIADDGPTVQGADARPGQNDAPALLDPPKNAASKTPQKRSKPNHGSPRWILAAKSIAPLGSAHCSEVPMARLADIATSFGIPFHKMLANLANGRCFSPWGEEICAAIGLVELHAHKDERGSDGLLAGGAGKSSIKSLTRQRGVKFQMSSYIGAGRSCGFAELRHSIEQAEVHMVVDISRPESLRIVSLSRDLLIAWQDAGLLTPSGLSSPEELYDLCRITAAKKTRDTRDIHADDPGLAERNRAAAELWVAQQAPRPDPF